MIINTKEYKSVICLDGNIPINFIKNTSLPIIATDGVANVLLQHKINPFVVIGDLDSVNQEVLSRCNCRKIDRQDDTDYEKALSFVDENNLNPSIVTGLNGGYIDRIIMNLGIFYQHNIMYVDDDMVGVVVEGYKEFKLPLYTKVSVLGMDEVTVTSKGLKWDMNHMKLRFSGASSGCNRVANETVQINTFGGKVFVFIYLNDIIDAGR